MWIDGDDVCIKDEDTNVLTLVPFSHYVDQHGLDFLPCDVDFHYTSETLVSPDGLECTVLDTTKLDFSRAQKARKSAETLVVEAKDGELLQTKNTKGQIESEYVTKQGDAIFINLHNREDRYVPASPRGTRWKFTDLASKNYIIVGEDDGGVRVENGNVFPVLHEVITKPTCLKDAWGRGHHQFLFAGATLKMNDDGHVTGIDKTSFDKTWEIVS